MVIFSNFLCTFVVSSSPQAYRCTSSGTKFLKMEIKIKKITDIFNLLTVLSLLALTGCNSDIFVSPVGDVVDSVTLSGDCGTASFQIQKKGLVSVDFDVDSYESQAFTTHTIYYDSEGESLNAPVNINDVARILYCSHKFALEFNVVGDKVDIVALDNAYSSTIDIIAYLNYGYTGRSVTIHVGPGKPLEIYYLGHDTLHPIIGTITETGLPQRFNNNTDHPLRITVYPYREAKSSLTLTPDEPWTEGISGTVPVPSYVDGKWNDFESDEVEVTIGSTTTFCSAAADEDEAAYIEVPANSSVTAMLEVTYAVLDTKYITDIRLPNSGLGWHSDGWWELRQPISYNLKTTTE